MMHQPANAIDPVIVLAFDALISQETQGTTGLPTAAARRMLAALCDAGHAQVTSMGSVGGDTTARRLTLAGITATCSGEADLSLLRNWQSQARRTATI